MIKNSIYIYNNESTYLREIKRNKDCTFAAIAREDYRKASEISIFKKREKEKRDNLSYRRFLMTIASS